MDVAFFFAKNSTFQGLYNCKFKIEMTLKLEFYFAEKKKESWQDGLLHLL